MRYSDRVDWDSEDSILTGMTSIAICGIEDPVRPEVGSVSLRLVPNLLLIDPCSLQVLSQHNSSQMGGHLLYIHWYFSYTILSSYTLAVLELV